MTKPFAGVRVVEVAAWTFVPAAGAVMADLGADVIKVEPPTGDPQRGLTNLLALLGSDGANPFLEIPNRGKRSITLDLTSDEGRKILLDLVASADVFLTSYLPATRDKLRVNEDDIRAVNPNIIYVRGSGWGPNGPMRNQRGYDLAAGWASSSMAFKMTNRDDPPIAQPAAFFDLQGANTIAGAIGTALFHREKTGEPTVVDVSLLSVGMWALSPDIMAGPAVGAIPSGGNRKHSPNPLTNVYQTSDGRWIYLVCLQADRFWAELCHVIGRPELADDERFTDMAVRGQNAQACIEELDKSFSSKTFEEWRTILSNFSGVWAPVLMPAELHEHEQVGPNGYLPEVIDAAGQSYRLPAAPMAFDEPPVPAGPCPELGQHTEEILLELGRDWEQIAALRDAGALG